MGLFRRKTPPASTSTTTSPQNATESTTQTASTTASESAAVLESTTTASGTTRPAVAETVVPQDLATVQSSTQEAAWKNLEQNLEAVQAEQQAMQAQLKQQLLRQRSEATYAVDAAGLSDSEQAVAQAKVTEIDATLTKWFGTARLVNPIHWSPERRYVSLIPGLLADDTSEDLPLAAVTALLAAHDLDADVLTLDFEPQLRHTWQHLAQQQVTSTSSRLLNLFEDLQDLEQAPAVDVKLPMAAGDYVVTDETNHFDQVFDHHDQLLMRVERDEQEQIQFVKHLDEQGRLVSVDRFDAQGHLVVTQWFDLEKTARVVREHYYRADGQLALVKTSNNGTVRWQLYGAQNILLRTFTGEKDLVTWWLENRVLTPFSTVILPISSPWYPILVAEADSGVQVLPVVTLTDRSEPHFLDVLAGRQRVAGILATDQQIVAWTQANMRQPVALELMPPVKELPHEDDPQQN